MVYTILMFCSSLCILQIQGMEVVAYAPKVYQQSLYDHSFIRPSAYLSNVPAHYELASDHLNSVELGQLTAKSYIQSLERHVDYRRLLSHLSIMHHVHNIGGLECLLKLSLPFTNKMMPANLQCTIDKVVNVLYQANGLPKPIIAPMERYFVARIVTDYLKTTNPDWKGTIKTFADCGYEEFKQVLSEESINNKPWWTHKWSQIQQSSTALFDGLKISVATSYQNNNVQELKQNVLTNSFTQDVNRLNILCGERKFVAARDIVRTYAAQQYNDATAREKYEYLQKLYQAATQKYYNALLPEQWREHASPQAVVLVKDYIFGDNQAQALENIYAAIAKYTDKKPQIAQSLQAILNEQGLPDMRNYNAHVLKRCNNTKSNSGSHDHVPSCLSMC